MHRLNGVDIMVLPPKHERVRTVKLSKKERRIYDELHREAKAKFDGFVARGQVATNTLQPVGFKTHHLVRAYLRSLRSSN